MPTVIDDNTGEEVEIRQVEAVAAVANVSMLRNNDLPPDAGKRIEAAMSAAAAAAMALEETDPVKIRAAMLEAREREKIIMRNEIVDRLSQEAAEQK